MSARSMASGKSGHSPLGSGEVGAGTKHKAASAEHGRSTAGAPTGSLDIAIQVEIDQHDHDGHCKGYGLTVPALTYKSCSAWTGRRTAKGASLKVMNTCRLS